MKNVQKITLNALHTAKEGKNQDFLTMELSSPNNVASSAGAVGMFLGKQSKRVAFQSIHKAQLAEMSKSGLKEGADLNAIFDGIFQIKVTELTQPEFDALTEEEQLGYQEKLYIENGAEVKLVSGGLPIWRKVQFCGISEGVDKLVEDDNKAERASARAKAKATATAGEEVA